MGLTPRNLGVLYCHIKLAFLSSCACVWILAVESNSPGATSHQSCGRSFSWCPSVPCPFSPQRPPAQPEDCRWSLCDTAWPLSLTTSTCTPLGRASTPLLVFPSGSGSFQFPSRRWPEHKRKSYTIHADIRLGSFYNIYFTPTLTLSVCHTHTHLHTHTHTLSLCHTHTYTHSLSPSHTHRYTLQIHALQVIGLYNENRTTFLSLPTGHFINYIRRGLGTGTWQADVPKTVTVNS